jgi:hypothetical protein
MRGGGRLKPFELYEKDIKMPSKSHETVPLKRDHKRAMLNNPLQNAL